MTTLNCCVFCYKNVDSSQSLTVNVNGECVMAKFIQLFQRHVKNFSLESSQIKVIMSALTFIPDNGTDNHSVKLLACHSCSKMLSSFNTSYGELKCAEMKANWCLQQLANVVRCADYAPAGSTKLKESVSSLVEDNVVVNNTIEVIGKFRQELQVQCDLRYMNQFPHVALKKLSLGQNSTENLAKDNEQNGWIAPAAASKSNDAKEFTENEHSVGGLFSPPLSPVCNADDGMEEEINPGEVVTFPKLENSHSDKMPNVFQCSCDKSFSTKRGLRIHRQRNCTERHAFKFACRIPGCDKRLETKVSLRNHELQCQNKLKTPLQRQLLEHLLDYGDIGIDEGQNYTEYRVQIIENATSKSCSSCHLDFASENELQQHLVTCAVTIKQEPIVVALPIENILREGKYRCDQCNYRSKYSKNLRYHKQTHLGPEAWKHTCNYCGKKFIRKENMTKHIRSHTGETPFKCPVDGCQAAFKHNQSLQNHLEKRH